MILYMILKRRKIILKNITTFIYQTKQDYKVLDERFDYDASEEVDTEQGDNTVMASDELTIIGTKKNYY